MMQRALSLIAQGEAGSVDGLARGLGVSPSLAEQLLVDLVRLGYMRSVRTCGCAVGCRGCPAVGQCAGLPLLWALTETGRRAVARQTQPVE